jgi:serine/threonine protein kinase
MNSDAPGLPPGKLIDGRFRVLEFIGRGANGQVYKCTNILTGDDVAVKILNPALIENDIAAERFFREAKLSCQLKHEAVVSVKSFGKAEDGSLYMVQEFITGKTLAQILKEPSQLTPDSIKAVAIDVAKALAYSHSQNVLHRDLKPENIMISNGLGTETCTAKVLDFGLAALIETPENQQKLTKTGVFIGTPAYMSPERCKGEKAGPESDIYSLGCIIYEMLFKHPPFVADSTMQVISMHLTDEPGFPADTKISKQLKSIIQKCLNKAREERYSDCNQLAEDLAKLSFKIEKKPHLRLLLTASLFAIVCACSGIIFWMTTPKAEQKKAHSSKTREQSRNPKRSLTTNDIRKMSLHNLVSQSANTSLDTDVLSALQKQIIVLGLRELKNQDKNSDEYTYLTQEIMTAYTALYGTADAQEKQRYEKEGLAFAKKYKEGKGKDLSDFYFRIAQESTGKKAKEYRLKSVEANIDDFWRMTRALTNAESLLYSEKDTDEADFFLKIAKNIFPKYEHVDKEKFRIACCDYEIAILKNSKDRAKQKRHVEDLLSAKYDDLKVLTERLDACNKLCDFLLRNSPEESLQFNDWEISLIEELSKKRKFMPIENSVFGIKFERSYILHKLARWKEQIKLNEELERETAKDGIKAELYYQDGLAWDALGNLNNARSSFELAVQYSKVLNFGSQADILAKMTSAYIASSEREKARSCGQKLDELIRKYAPTLDQYKSIADSALKK